MLDGLAKTACDRCQTDCIDFGLALVSQKRSARHCMLHRPDVRIENIVDVSDNFHPHAPSWRDSGAYVAKVAATSRNCTVAKEVAADIETRSIAR
jgi:hypothetical protein